MATANPSHCVLVVDDDPITLETVAELLEAAGYCVVVASGGDQAWLALRTTNPRPELLLLDLIMPRGSGWELLERLRGDPELCDIPVVIMSGGPTPSHVRPPYGYLEKPLQRDELLTKLRSALLH
jgi:CheY-like chemotaxis protein